VKRAHYKHGHLDGLHEEYWPIGIQKRKGQFKMGKKVGLWIKFNQQGDIEKRVSYHNDIEINIPIDRSKEISEG